MDCTICLAKTDAAHMCSYCTTDLRLCLRLCTSFSYAAARIKSKIPATVTVQHGALDPNTQGHVFSSLIMPSYNRFLVLQIKKR